MSATPAISPQVTIKTYGPKLPLKIAAVFGAYFVAGKLGLSIPFTSGNVSPIWPAAGFALAAVLLGGYKIWPGIALGALAVNFFSPVHPVSAVGIAFGNASSALFGGYLSRRLGGLQLRSPALRDVLKLILLATLSPIVAATVGTSQRA
jgi:integral membrane sensor domain MASE1